MPPTILSEVEQGPQGILYRSRDTRTGKDVSLRVPPPSWPLELCLFAAEKASSLEHPHIASVAGAGWHDGRPYVIFGEELGPRLQPAALSAREAVGIVRDVARAVDYAAGRGFTHPGLAPDLLHVPSSGHVVVTGYELPGAVPTAAPYRAPEVRRGVPVDAAANVYSLGAILYAFLTRREPEVDPPSPPDVPENLAFLVREAMRVDASGRPSAETFALALSRWLESDSAPAPLPPAPERRARKDLLVGTGLVALLLLAFLIVPGGKTAPAAAGEVAVQAPAPPLVEAPPPKPPLPARVTEVEAPPPNQPPPPDPVPLAVGTVKYVHGEYGVFVALEPRATVKVGDALEVVQKGDVVTVLKVRTLSRPETLYPHGAAVCDASGSGVKSGQTVRRSAR